MWPWHRRRPWPKNCELFVMFWLWNCIEHSGNKIKEGGGVVYGAPLAGHRPILWVSRDWSVPEHCRNRKRRFPNSDNKHKNSVARPLSTGPELCLNVDKTNFAVMRQSQTWRCHVNTVVHCSCTQNVKFFKVICEFIINSINVTSRLQNQNLIFRAFVLAKVSTNSFNSNVEA